MDDLEGKVAVVTGGAKGIGFGMAQAFAEEGMRLVLADIDTDALDRAVASLTSAGVEAIGVSTDVADPAAVDHLRDESFERFGTVHLLCNNAGTGARSELTEPIAVGVWEQIVALDLYSILYGLNAFLPRMLEQGEGHIVNTSSRQGLVASAHQGPYPAAKAGSIALTEMLREELAELGAPIGTTVLTPGGVRTEGIVEALARHERGEAQDEAMHAFLASRVAAGVEPIELGRLVVRAVRGNVLYVNTHRETLEWLQARVDRMVTDATTLGLLR